MSKLHQTPTPNTQRLEQALQRAINSTGCVVFESRDEATTRNAKMLRRFARLGTVEPRRKIQKIARCGPCEQVATCPAACHLASRAERARLIFRLWERLRDVEEGVWLVTIVNEAWAQEEGELALCQPATLLRWLDRRLDRLAHLKSGLVGVAGVDVCLNEREGQIQWQPRLHLLVTGLDKRPIQRVLRIKPTASTLKPLMFKAVKREELSHVIGYVLKRSVEKRVAYSDSRRTGNRRSVKVPRSDLAEHDQWLLGQKVAERFRVIGMRLSRKPLGIKTSSQSDAKTLRRPYLTPFWLREDEKDES